MISAESHETRLDAVAVARGADGSTPPRQPDRRPGLRAALAQGRMDYHVLAARSGTSVGAVFELAVNKDLPVPTAQSLVWMVRAPELRRLLLQGQPNSHLARRYGVSGTTLQRALVGLGLVVAPDVGVTTGGADLAPVGDPEWVVTPGQRRAGSGAARELRFLSHLRRSMREASDPDRRLTHARYDRWAREHPDAPSAATLVRWAGTWQGALDRAGG